MAKLTKRQKQIQAIAEQFNTDTDARLAIDTLKKFIKDLHILVFLRQFYQYLKKFN